QSADFSVASLLAIACSLPISQQAAASAQQLSCATQQSLTALVAASQHASGVSQQARPASQHSAPGKQHGASSTQQSGLAVQQLGAEVFSLVVPEVRIEPIASTPAASADAKIWEVILFLHERLAPRIRQHGLVF
ncbi:MAG: hypothetical protein KDA61_15140, partial [Planctomycetales bacterium]|nr:hypothetical protein [Planctomycetales bacterium]